MPGHYTFERCEVRPAERQVLVDGAEASMLEVETWLRACDPEALDRAA